MADDFAVPRPAPSSEDGRNRQVFEDEAVVSDYAGAHLLTTSEAILYAAHVPPGSRVLDLGVGTGRTTGHLAPSASTYVGIDYSEAMVTVARQRYPGVDLRVGDAADLSAFADRSADVIVFSYNGLDYLHPDPQRRACLRECRRVLADDGVLLLSRHNPRCLVDWPSGGSARLRRVAAAAYMSARRTVRLVRTRAFWRGSGYVFDAARGGLWTHMTTPGRFCAEAEEHGLEVVRRIGSRAPRRFPSVCHPWHHYVLTHRTSGTAVGRPGVR
ncbi:MULTISPECIES: class I SAM-dependent methyltransferase [unclassified Blastococcus]